MAFEPLAGTLSVLGVLLGLLGFLSSSVENLALKHDDWKHSRHNIHIYTSRLGRCRQRLEVWEKEWVLSGGQQGRLVQIWGPAGYEAISKQVGLVTSQMNDIRAIITKLDISDDTESSSNGMSSVELQDWRRSCTALCCSSSVAIRQKIVLLLWRKRLLNDKIASLATSLDELEAASTHFYHEPGHARDISSPQPIKTAKQWRERMENFTIYMDHVRQNQQSATHTWSLVLEPPSDKEHIKDCRHCIFCLKNDHDLFIHFVIRSQPRHAVHEVQGHAVTYTYTGRSDSRPDAHRKRDLRPDKMIRQPLMGRSKPRSLAVGLSQRRDPEVTDKLMELRRTTSALVFVNWALMLLETDWLSGASIEDLHYVEFNKPIDDDGTNDDARKAFFVSDIYPETSRQVTLDGHPAQCFLRLGVVLAELAIGEKVVIEDRLCLKFIVYEGHTSRRFEDVNALLREVGRGKVLHTYRKAVETAFDLSIAMRGRDFVPIALLARALEQVLVP